MKCLFCYYKNKLHFKNFYNRKVIFKSCNSVSHFYVFSPPFTLKIFQNLNFWMIVYYPFFNLHCSICIHVGWNQTCLGNVQSIVNWAICCSVSFCLSKHLNKVFLFVSLALSAHSVGMLWDIMWWPHASPACCLATMVISGCSTVRRCPPSTDWMPQVWDVKNTIYALYL